MSRMMSKAVESARNDLRRNIERQKRAVKLLSHPVIGRVWSLFPAKVRKDISVYAEDYDGASPEITFQLAMWYLDSMTDKRLLRTLEPFAGWDANSRDWTGGSMPNRDFCFSRALDGVKVTVRINAYIRPDSPTCQLVVKGVTTRTVTEEVREIVCSK